MSLCPQAPSAVVMIRPHHFFPNEETKQDNSFQTKTLLDKEIVSRTAYQQLTQASEQLTAAGIKVHLFEDQSEQTPDSVFPNNWFSTHADGHIVIYPMYAENRRKERRNDVIELLKAQYQVRDVIDYSTLESQNVYLEGTGAMVLDHIEQIAYVARSKRVHPQALVEFCHQLNFKPVVFDAQDKHGVPVYHTNVLMCIGHDFVIAGFEMIKNQQRRAEIIQGFKQAGKSIISLSEQQINAFCGNALELQGSFGRILALSTTANAALTCEQRATLEQSVKLLPLEVSAIEFAGGSVRCMLAGIHLAKR